MQQCWLRVDCLTGIIFIAGDPGSTKSQNANAQALQPASPAAVTAAADLDAAADLHARHQPVQADPAHHAVSHHGRSLKQLGYDPYGIGYYDPYQAGVTPGFVNVDLNRETGLHVDVGTVAVDVSADKNYYGLGVGNLVGVGAAKDRGWNLQLGGGSILDVSVTKDAGLGLWLLNGLANIQIGPDGRGWETGHIAAQNVPGEQPEAAAAAAAATPAGQAPQQVTSVVVDEAHPDGSNGQPSGGAVDGVVHAASEVPAAAVEEPIITEEPINLSLSAAVDEASRGAVLPATAAPRSSSARRSRPPRYVEPRPPTYVEPRPGAAVSDSDAVVLPVAAQSSDAAAVDPAELAATPPDVTAWGPAPALQPLPTTDLQRSTATVQNAAAGTAPVQPAVTAAAAAAAPMPRRACEGGAMVAVAGNKFKCRYRRTRQAASANDVRTYPSGVAA